LKTYPGSIGITHYLTNRLRSFDYEDVEFYWPQLCYLVITRTTPSTALENFILERCQEDSHIAVITLWYLQASLSDFANTPKSEHFTACHRILNRVQEIIFNDPPLPPSASTSSSSAPAASSATSSTSSSAALQDVSTRLVLVPKPARLSSLRAELTVLNHGLPRGCSLGMTTRAPLDPSAPKTSATLPPPPRTPFDTPRPPRPRRKQARIVRISPSEASVLNSADRAPFVIYVEVLEEDLDFDPDRRSNWEDLRRALRERDGFVAGTSSPAGAPPSPRTPFAERADYALGSGLDTMSPSDGDLGDGPAGEMDLVEQLTAAPAPAATARTAPTPTSRSTTARRTSSRGSARTRRGARASRRSGRRRRRRGGSSGSARASLAGQPPLNAQVAALSHAAAEANSGTGSAPSASAVVVGASGSSTPAPLPTQRPRVLAPQDAAAIRERIMSEMLALEEERMERMRGEAAGWGKGGKDRGAARTEDNSVVLRAVNKDDPSGAVLGESYTAKKARIRAASPFGHLSHWSLLSCIVKTGADLRQEQLAVQLISEFGRIWSEEKCPGWVYYFRILVTSENSGLIETINDAVSVHSLKKNAYASRAEDDTQVFDSFTLYDHFVATYGPVDSKRYRKAQDAFIESLAAYSVICYLLQLKDRHNGNILLDLQGHLIHIDFGFMLSNSPGSLGFEMAPFKLPQDYIDILGGFDSAKFAEFRALFKRCFRDARKHAERIITLVELMQKDSSLPCFANGDLTSQQLRERFMLSLPQAQLDEYADKLILNSAQSSFTRLYECVAAVPLPRLLATLSPSVEERNLTSCSVAVSSRATRTASCKSARARGDDAHRGSRGGIRARTRRGG
ncbi:uncharacterized protein RHOBADRAFT_18305, partial [Rhodotorula graminis WP1]